MLVNAILGLKRNDVKRTLETVCRKFYLLEKKGSLDFHTTEAQVSEEVEFCDKSSFTAAFREGTPYV